MLFCIVLVFPQPSKVKYNHYVNVRFEYSVNYPTTLIAQGEADNGDGQRFISKDKKAEMAVYGAYNALEQSLKDLYEEAISEKEKESAIVTYKVLKRDFFVISGKGNGKIFYQKTIKQDDIFKTLIIEYDESLKETFNPITSVISNSFKNTGGH
jgi:hypothetical protein